MTLAVAGGIEQSQLGIKPETAVGIQCVRRKDANDFSGFFELDVVARLDAILVGQDLGDGYR